MRARLLFFAAILAAGCNDESLVHQPGAQPSETPVDTATPAPTPSSTSTVAATPTPIPTPFPTPVPCAFYGISPNGGLWLIDPSVPSASLVGTSPVQNLTDLTITPSLDMIAISADAAWRIDPTSGITVPYQSDPWIDGQNALKALSDGRMLVGGGSSLMTVGSSSVHYLPLGYNFSGDIAAAPGASTGYASGLDIYGGPDHLFSVDLASGNIANMGSLTETDVYGLDVGCDGVLYGITQGDPSSGAKPKVLKIDMSNGFTSAVGSLNGPIRIWGATGPVN